MLLNGWKQIADHLGRGVRTVQRWEALGLPIRRPHAHLHSSVVARSEDLDAWIASRHLPPAVSPLTAPAHNQRTARKLCQRLQLNHLRHEHLVRRQLELIDRLRSETTRLQRATQTCPPRERAATDGAGC